MKITFILPGLNLSGGIRVISIYAERLRRRGHRVVVVAAASPRKLGLKSRVRDMLRGRGWKWRSESARDGTHFEDSRVKIRITDRYRPITDADVPDADVVVATWWETSEWVAALSMRK